MLYTLSLGHDRARLTPSGRLRDYGSWRSITIATGEIPILGDSTQQGALNRVLEIRAEPFDEPRDAQEVHRFVESNHGQAGREFVRALQKNRRARLIERVLPPVGVNGVAGLDFGVI